MEYILPKLRNPVMPPQCMIDDWLIRVNTIEDVTQPSRDHAYITPSNVVWVLDYNDNLIPLGSDGIARPTTLANADGYFDLSGSTDFNQVINFRLPKLDALIQKAIDEITIPEYITDGLAHYFDFNDNEATGTHNPNATGWVDLITGTVATLQNTTWGDGLVFATNNAKCYYSGENVVQYTITNTHKIHSLTGVHPRIFAENTYPSLYLQSNIGYAYGFYGQSKDAAIPPYFIPPTNTLVQATLRFTGTVAQGGSGTVELFVNGVKTGEMTNVTINPSAVATKYIGCRSDNTRTIRGSFFEHLVYTRALSDEEIYNNYLVSTHRYPRT